jgi:hypothetical protein
MFVAVLGFVGWMALPLSHGVSQRDEGAPPRQATRPAPAPFPRAAAPIGVVEAARPTPEPAVQAPASATAPAEPAPHPAFVQATSVSAKSSSKSKPAHPVVRPKAVSPRAADGQHEERREPTSSSSAAHEEAPTQAPPFVPRSGLLSPEDF